MTDIVVRCVTVRLGTLSSIPMILAPTRVTGTKFLERSDQLKDFSKLGHQLPRSSHLGSNEVKSQISAKTMMCQDFYGLAKQHTWWE